MPICDTTLVVIRRLLLLPGAISFIERFPRHICHCLPHLQGTILIISLFVIFTLAFSMRYLRFRSTKISKKDGSGKVGYFQGVIFFQSSGNPIARLICFG